MRTLLERIKPEFKKLIEDNKDDDSYEVSIKALSEKNYMIDLNYGELVAITSLTHPGRSARLYEVTTMFND